MILTLAKNNHSHQGCHCPPLPPNLSSKNKVEDKSGGIGGKSGGIVEDFSFCLLAYTYDIYVKLKHFKCRLNHIIIVFLKTSYFFF